MPRMDDNMGATANKPFYIAVWRRVLTEWLRWPDERVRRWMMCYDDDLEGRGSPFFYHEDALYYVSQFLIPDGLALRLGRYESSRLSWRLTRAIGVGMEVERSPAFDWDAARERVEAALREHGETLAGPQDHIAHVRRRLGADCP
jgi:hypothetical protein